MSAHKGRTRPTVHGLGLVRPVLNPLHFCGVVRPIVIQVPRCETPNPLPSSSAQPVKQIGDPSGHVGERPGHRREHR